LKYLANRFVLKNAQGEQKKLRWIGMEQKTDAVWLYVETEMPEGLTDAALENRIFQEMLKNQVNLVTTRRGGEKHDLVFKAGDKSQKLITVKKTTAPAKID
jgi:DNA-binding sugar fermentation-stimulating protein